MTTRTAMQSHHALSTALREAAVADYKIRAICRAAVDRLGDVAPFKVARAAASHRALALAVLARSVRPAVPAPSVRSVPRRDPCLSVELRGLPRGRARVAPQHRAVRKAARARPSFRGRPSSGSLRPRGGRSRLSHVDGEAATEVVATTSRKHAASDRRGHGARRRPCAGPWTSLNASARSRKKAPFMRAQTDGCYSVFVRRKSVLRRSDRRAGMNMDRKPTAAARRQCQGRGRRSAG